MRQSVLSLGLLISTGCAVLSDSDLRARLDADRDGVQLGADCDDADASVQYGPTWFRDADGDGFGDSRSPQFACTQPEGFVDDSTDCNDADAAISPAVDEICNGFDDDCDLLVDQTDPSLAHGKLLYPDRDGDGDGPVGATPVERCEEGLGWASSAQDCDDHDPEVSSKGVEVCDGKDNDCDGRIDADDSDVTGARTFFVDGDRDAFGDGGAPSLISCSFALAGYALVAGDCDDQAANIYPGAAEICGPVDRDCDGLIGDEDADAAGQSWWFADLDGDGFGDANVGEERCPGDGWVLHSGDCDDTTAARSPAATDVCADGVDSNCDELPPQCAVPATLLTGRSPDWTLPQLAQGQTHMAVADLGGAGIAEVLVASSQATGSLGGRGVVWAYELPMAADALPREVVSTDAVDDGFASSIAVVSQPPGADVLVIASPLAASGDGAVGLFSGLGSLGPSDALATLSPAPGSGLRLGERLAAGALLPGREAGIAMSTTQGVQVVPASVAGSWTVDEVAVTTITGMVPHAIAVGDLSGDGVDDLAIAGPDDVGGAGGVWVFLGPLLAGSVGTDAADAFLAANSVDEGLGRVLQVVPDMDGDGAGELFVSATTTTGEGLLSAFSSVGAATVRADAILTLSGADALDAVLPAPNLNADALGDAVLLASDWRGLTASLSTGRAWALHGGVVASGAADTADGVSVISTEGADDYASLHGAGVWAAAIIPDQTGDQADEVLLLVPLLSGDVNMPGSGGLFLIPGSGF